MCLGLGRRKTFPSLPEDFLGHEMAELLWKLRTADAESKAEAAALPTATEEGNERDLQIH